MHTIQLQLQDDVYEDMKKHNINIQEKFKEFLFNVMDDGYPSISTAEAKKRIATASDEYYKGTGTYLNEDEYEKEMREFEKSI